ncbi:MAG: four helix bundle protein [Chloroflexi bacterium]|nr:four helix bundle protein [Chloroflexota bacterium]
MDEQEFKNRTKNLALRVIKLAEALPNTRTADVIGRQLLRCGTSVGANYRSACRAKSTADIVAKLGIVEEEADETLYRMELLIEAGLIAPERMTSVMKETNEILAMTVASIKTLRAKLKVNPKSQIANPKSNGRSKNE